MQKQHSKQKKNGEWQFKKGVNSQDAECFQRSVVYKNGWMISTERWAD